MMNKKSLCALTLCAVMLLSACSSKPAPEPAPPATDSANPPVSADVNWAGMEKSKGLSGTVSYMHFGDDYERQMYADMFSAYQKLVPNVKVEQMFTPGSDYYTKLQTLGASKTLPDVFWVSESRLAEFGEAGLLTDLAPYLEQYPDLKNDMVSGLADYGVYKDKTYGIPKDWTSYVMYINKDMFKAAGIPIPTSEWTMDDYLEIAKKLTVKEGDRVVQYGTAVNNYRADWVNFMGNFEAPWFKDGKSNISDPLAIKGLSYQTQLIKDGSAPSPGSVSSTGDSEDRLFIIGKIAMFPSGRWVVPSFRTECDFEWTAVEMPKGTTRCTPFISGILAIGESSKNKDAAANLISYQMSDPGLKYVMTSALAMPAYNHLMTDAEYVNTPPEADAFVATSKYLGNKEQMDALMTGKWAKFNDVMRAELSLAYEGEQTLEEAAAKIDKLCNETVFAGK
ncbi:MAG: sugar ABC transporter substrate-binding protein [Oscillospiraceae bacterium]